MAIPTSQVRGSGVDCAPRFSWDGSQWVEEPIGATHAVTVTAAVNTLTTLTLPAPGAGLRQYLTSVQVVMYSTAARTGNATPVLVTPTNLPALTLTFPSAGAVGTITEQKFEWPKGLKATNANTNVTVVGPATTNVIWRMNATYFIA